MNEQAKYEAMWQHDAYRVVAPGTYAVQQFLEVADPKRGATVRDLGCGTGRAGLALKAAGLEVEQYDFAANCRDPGIDLPFVQHDLNKPIPGKPADLAFCTDVLEHIPRKEVQRVLLNVCGAGWRTYLQISCTDDVMGALIGEPLHLTVEPYEWWKAQLEALECKILWSEDKGTHCAFYVSAYADATEVGPKSVMNVDEATVKAQVLANLAAGYEEVSPHEARDDVLIILAGGPSLNDYEDEIVARRKAGEYVVTVNGTHGWLRDRGLEPSLHIQCDAREFNKRFVENPGERTLYLIASQSHPSVAASLPKERVRLWHSGHHLADLISEFHRSQGREPPTWYPVFGGGTVMLRTLPLLMQLGFHRFEIYGFDSAVRDVSHHAYSQPENDGKTTMTARVGGREFEAHPWMIAQAGDFLRMQAMLAPHIDLIVHGDGLISHMIKTAAED